MSREHSDYERIVREIVAARLRAIRAEAGQSQAEFAERVGLGLKTYGNYERQQRELPQSSRLAIIDKTATDPLPTEALFAAARGEAMEAGDGRRPKVLQKQTFRQELRAECRAFRENNYSKPARLLLALRDNAFATATIYGFVDVYARQLNIPLGLPQPAADWLLVLSFAIVVMLFIPVISEFPTAKVVRHMRGRALSRRC